MGEKKEFLVYWRDDARAVFATLEEAEAYAGDNVISQPFSNDKFVVCVAVADVSAVREADDTRVIRIVRAERAAPSSGQEPGVVAVLRELVAWSAAPGLYSSDVLRIAESARRVLASSSEAGPDPSAVVRAAMAWRSDVDGERENDLAAAVDAYRKAGGK